MASQDGPRRSVVFVREGVWGQVSQTEHDAFLDRIVHLVQRAARVEVVSNLQAARELCRICPRPDTVVFNSRGAAEAARILQGEFPGIRVVIMTGLIPRGEILWFSKGWLEDPQFLLDVLFIG